MSVLAAAIVYTMIASSFFMIANGMFSAHKASRTATQAQQYADIDANTLQLLAYDTLDEKGAHPRQNITSIEGADGWQDEVLLTDEKIIDKDEESKQRIATVKIYKEGDILSRFSLQVPLSSQGTTVGVPIGTVIAWPMSGDPAGIWSGFWLECNGQAVDASKYPKLAKLMSAVPDYRGVFLRGLGSQLFSDSFGTITHSSAALNMIQGDSSRTISGSLGDPGIVGGWNGYNYDTNPFYFGSQGYRGNVGLFFDSTYATYRYTLSGSKDTEYTLNEQTTSLSARGVYNVEMNYDISRTVPTSNEFRPINKAIRYMIKAK